MPETSTPDLVLDDLHVFVEGTEIVAGVSLEVARGQIYAVMGPNGSGKSTLANAIMGNPAYKITGGRVLFKGADITALPPNERAIRGLFLAFQYPEEIPGVSVINFLRQALSNKVGIDLSILELRLKIMEAMAGLKMDPAHADRYLNEGFSGGEKKRNEILQMAVLEPEIAVLDETDSGLDVDALRIVADGVNRIVTARAPDGTPKTGVLVITHYQRLLDHLTPDAVHVLVGGRIVESGGPELARRLEVEGYEVFRVDDADLRSGVKEPV